MHGYCLKYPEYNLSQHKVRKDMMSLIFSYFSVCPNLAIVYFAQQGYPTAAHMAAIRSFGASPIHRRTFAPLKHMEFDGNGKVVVLKKSE
mmetsp:Transcript_6882/g.14268  ORF Transcript_6882/g.14268 Transcript_6882/m.14268 type:complete len:90 (-) Transcript_6882:1657-1926(-)